MKTLLHFLGTAGAVALVSGCAAMEPVKVGPPQGAATSAAGGPSARPDIQALRRKAAADPQNWRGYNELGVAYFQQRQFDDAVAAFEQALALHPITTVVEAEQKQQAALDAQRAAMQQQQKRAEEAQEAAAMSQLLNGLLGSMASMPGASPDLMQLAPTLSATVAATAQMPSGAAPDIPRTVLESQMKPRKEVAAIQVNLGRAQLERGAYSPAASAFEQAASLDPTMVEALRYQAQAAYQLSNFAQAIALTRRYRALGAPSPEVHLLAADSFRALGAAAEAERESRAAVTACGDQFAADPNNAEAVRLLVRAHVSAGRYGLAEEALKSVAARSDSGDWNLDLAAVHYLQGKPAEALACARAAMNPPQSRNESLYALYLAALAHEELGQREESRRACQRLCEMGEESPVEEGMLPCVAVAMAGTGKAGEAVRILEERILRTPMSPGVAVEYHRLGLVYERMGRDADSLECFARAVQLRPGYAPSLRRIQALEKKHEARRAQLVRDAAAAQARGALADAVGGLAEACRLSGYGPGRKELLDRLLKLAARLDAPLPFPEEGQSHYLRGNAALKSARDPLDLDRAVYHYRWASFHAPWAAPVFLNASAAHGVRQRYGEAAGALRLYLAANPRAPNVEEILGKLAEMEYQQAEALRKLSSR